MGTDLKNEILIIGKIPPPVGGVTIHVLRLNEALTKQKYQKFHFYDFGKNRLCQLFSTLRYYKAAHLHTSNPYFQATLAIYCQLVRTKLIITYHGNWGRYGALKNLATSVSSWLAFIPVVQNQESFVRSRKFNKRSVLISAFIPPVDISPLTPEISQILVRYRKSYKYVFCTNASNLTFDKDGKEIYGILSLVEKFSEDSSSALIIADPSGKNKKYAEDRFQQLADNVYFITVQHDFWNILKACDGFIRNTTTDGDSISIHEALSCGTSVFATECVPRPYGCTVYSKVSELNFEKELDRIKSRSEKDMPKQKVDTVTKILTEYAKCLVKSKAG